MLDLCFEYLWPEEHKSLVDRLDPTVVKKRMMVVHDEFLEQEAEHLGDNQWDEEFLDEGFDLLTLAVELGNADETFAEVVSGDVGRRPRDDAFRDPKARLEAMKAYEMQLQYHEARDFFEKKVRSVEIKWNNELSRIFFPKPSECEFLSDETKERIKASMDYGDDDRVRAFLNCTDEVVDEAQHLELMNRKTWYRVLGSRLHLFKTVSFFLAILVRIPRSLLAALHMW